MIIGISGKKQHGKDTVGKMLQYLAMNPKKNSGISLEAFIHTISQEERDKLSGWKRKLFAEKLKVGLQHEFPKQFNVDMWENNEPGYRDEIMPSLGTSRRDALQKKGAKMREIHEDYWVRSVMNEYVPIHEPPYATRRFQLGLKDKHDGHFIIPERHDIPKKYWGTKINTPTFEYTEPITEPEYPNWIFTDLRYPNEAREIKRLGGKVIRVNNPRIKSTDTHHSETALDDYLFFDYVITNDTSLNDLLFKVNLYVCENKILPVC